MGFAGKRNKISVEEGFILFYLETVFHSVAQAGQELSV